MQEAVALVAALAALAGTILGSLLNSRRLQYEREQWQNKLDNETSRWRVEYERERQRWLTELHAKQDEQRVLLLERILDRRLATFGSVLSLLGRVRDYDSPDGLHHRLLKDDPQQLSGLDEELLSCLYGDAGLVMSMDTRNAILEASQMVGFFQRGEVSFEDLCEVFFMARRFLRSDLQIRDDSRIKGEVEKMQEEFKRLLEDSSRSWKAGSDDEVQG